MNIDSQRVASVYDGYPREDLTTFTEQEMWDLLEASGYPADLDEALDALSDVLEKYEADRMSVGQTPWTNPHETGPALEASVAQARGLLERFRP